MQQMQARETVSQFPNIEETGLSREMPALEQGVFCHNLKTRGPRIYWETCWQMVGMAMIVYGLVGRQSMNNGNGCGLKV